MGLGAPSPQAAPRGLLREQYLYPKNFRTASFLYLHLFGIKRPQRFYSVKFAGPHSEHALRGVGRGQGT